MAITVAKGTSILIKIGDGASPEVFAHPCMINTDRSISVKGNMVSDVVENCTDPDQPGIEHNETGSFNATLSGAGKLDAADVGIYKDYVTSGATVNTKVYVAGTLYATIPVKFNTFDITGTNHKFAEVSVAAVSTGWDGQ